MFSIKNEKRLYGEKKLSYGEFSIADTTHNISPGFQYPQASIPCKNNPMWFIKIFYFESYFSFISCNHYL